MKSFKSKLCVNQVLTITLISFLYMVLPAGLYAQNVAITDDDGYTVNSSAMLDVKSINKGLLIPRVVLVSTTDPVSGTKPEGLLVWNTSTSGSYPDPGFYYWSGSNWVKVGTSALDFQNGLTKSGNSVKLGGVLTESSTITQGDYSLNFNLTGTGDFNIQDEGTSAFFVKEDGNVGIGTTSPGGKLQVKGETIDDEEPLFEVKNKDGNTVFAVYNNGVRVYVDTAETKGLKGGFAVGGFSSSKGSKEYLRVTPDSVRIYVDGDNSKGLKGGFAVGGFSASKGTGNEYFRVTRDSVRVYLDTTTTKGLKGGFAVGGYSSSKGYNQEFLRVTNDSVRIYISEETGKGLKGGFAVGGYSSAKGPASNYFNISGEAAAGIINPSQSRVFWYPKKEAFLTGRVLIESPDSIGTNSMATGYESKSIGDWSQALGFHARAFGDKSMAIGNYANAIGNNSFAFGDSAKAVGVGSYAFGSVGRDETTGDPTGEPTTALGDYSFAIGLGAKADTIGAIAIGNEANAHGEFSTSLGYQSKALAKFSTALGYKSEASGYYSTALGHESVAIGNASIAAGEACVATGYGSAAFGCNTWATGTYSVAMGSLSDVTGIGSAGIGNEVFVDGDNSFGFGYKCWANGYASMSGGYQTHVTGDYSFGFGRDNIASGDYSVAFGYEAKASNSYSMAFGQEIESSGLHSVAWALNDQNGTNVTANNAFVIMGGNVGIGKTDPGTSRLYVVGTGENYAITAYNHDNTGINYGLCSKAGSSSTNAAYAIKGEVYRYGSGTYYSGHFVGVSSGGTYHGLYADLRSGDAIDLAEYIYDTYNNLEKADVVIIDADNDESVVHNSEPYSANVAGIVSTKPHLVMGMELIMDEETGEEIPGVNAVQLSLAGRVPVKVTDENGSVKRGDYITSSSIPGHAMKWTLLDVNEAEDFEGLKAILAENERRRNTIIGKALEEHTSGTGKIMVLISLQ